MPETLILTRDALTEGRRVEQAEPPVLRNETSQTKQRESVEVSIPEALIEQSEEVRVLHVDDNPEYADLVKTILERDNPEYAVSTATSAVEGVQKLSEGRYDCVVSDYQMPMTDGLEFLELVRDQHPDVPFILLTGAGDEELASKAIEAGVTDYVRKHGGTQQYDILANRIDNAVSRYHTRQQFWDALSWYQRLIEQDLVGVFVVRDGEFAFVNERFAKLCGHDRASLVGAAYTTLPDKLGGLAVALSDLGSANFPLRTAVTARCSDGSTTEVDTHIGTVQYDGERAYLGVLWTDDL